MASVTLYPSGTPSGSNATWSNASNAYDGYTTSSSASLTYGQKASTTMYGFLSVDTSSIPDGSKIVSVSVTTRINIKSDYGKGSNGSWTSCGAVLCAGTTEKGSLEELSEKGTDTTLTMSGQSWTLDELRDLRIKYSYTTNNYGSQDSAAVLTVYGATVTISYELGIQRTITLKLGSGLSADMGETTAVADGSTYKVTITPDSGVTITTATDNGADVLSKIETKTPQTGGEVSSYPTAYATSGSISGTRYRNCIGKGSSATATGNDYCGSRNSTATITYSFDFSSIPEEAVIESVSVVVGGHLENANSSTATLQLKSGSTNKGTATKFTSTSKQLVTVSAGTWTRAELQDAKLAFTIGYYGGLVNGVDWTVVYSIPSTGVYYAYTIGSVGEDHTILINISGSSPVFYVKSSAEWVAVSDIYKKQNGAWVLIDASDLDKTVKYRRGT